MPHVLASCYCNHYFPYTFKGYVQGNNYNAIMETSASVSAQSTCPECIKNGTFYSKLYSVFEYDPTFSLHIKTIKRITGDSAFSKVLSLYNFSDISGKNYRSTSTSIWQTSEGYALSLIGSSYKKTAKLIFVAPAKHPLIKDILVAVKADNETVKKQIVSVPKPKIPKVLQDACGEDIKIGDWVAFSSGSLSELRFGKILKLNPKSVTIRPRDNSKRTISGKLCTQIIKIPDHRALLWDFEQ